MKRTTSVVAVVILTGAAWGQNPGIIQRTKNALMGVQQQQTAASNAALHGTAPAKPSGAVAGKPAAPAPQPVPVVKPASTKPAAPAAPNKTQVTFKSQPPAVKKPTPTPKRAVGGAVLNQGPAGQSASSAPSASEDAKAEASNASGSSSSGAPSPASEKKEETKYAMTGKRDPFVSPVVNRQMGSGCSTGKKCLDIEQIALHGVVKSDNGMIAVVTNGMNKAYFLRENDPVFNGYVVKITGDSIVFKQNFQDRLGKPFTKDVVKRITTPAV